MIRAWILPSPLIPTWLLGYCRKMQHVNASSTKSPTTSSIAVSSINFRWQTMASLVLRSSFATKWCQDDVMPWKHFLHYWPFVRGNHSRPMDSPHKRSVLQNFDVFSVVGLHRLLNKHLNCQRFDMPWCSGDNNIDGLVQERRSSIANALELHLSCTNPSIWYDWLQCLQTRDAYYQTNFFNSLIVSIIQNYCCSYTF